jgi:hypothetical protein
MTSSHSQPADDDDDDDEDGSEVSVVGALVGTGAAVSGSVVDVLGGTTMTEGRVVGGAFVAGGFVAGGFVEGGFVEGGSVGGGFVGGGLVGGGFVGGGFVEGGFVGGGFVDGGFVAGGRVPGGFTSGRSVAGVLDVLTFGRLTVGRVPSDEPDPEPHAVATTAMNRPVHQRASRRLMWDAPLRSGRANHKRGSARPPMTKCSIQRRNRRNVITRGGSDERRGS